jgi:predicted XRE-type DNA-binding protein
LRIRNAKIARFSLDKMIAILGKLDEDVEVTVSFQPRRPVVQDMTPA